MPCTLQASSLQAGPGDSADEDEEERRFYGYNQMCYPTPPRGMAAAPAEARVNRPSVPARAERLDLDLKSVDLSRANGPAERLGARYP